MAVVDGAALNDGKGSQRSWDCVMLNSHDHVNAPR